MYFDPDGRMSPDVDAGPVPPPAFAGPRVVTAGDERRWVYTPRGYGAKAGTGIAAA